MSGSPRPLRPLAPSPAPRAPPPFLRRPSSVSSSSFLSTTTSSLSEPSTDDDSSDDSSSDDDAPTESYWSSSGLSGDEGRFVARLDLSLRAPTSGGGGGSSSAASMASSLGPGQAGTASPIARSNLRLSLAVLRARQSLASHSFDALASSLKSLSSALPALSTLSHAPSPAAENPLGVFLPTLARLASDVRAALRDEGDKGREFRRTKLARDDAKALVGLRQRWSSGAAVGGKGKARETDSLEWVPVVEAAVASNPPPDVLATDERFDRRTPSLLTSLEAFLLPSSLPRLSLCNLALTDADLVAWPALRRLEDVTAWYLSFVVGDPDEARRRARTALDGVKSLDLSKNKLTTFPLFLPRLFPHLETLSLSHNALAHLPPWVTLFSSLRRLRTHGNRLVSARKALKPLARPIGAEVKPSRVRAHPRSAGTRADVRDALPFVRAAVLEAPLEALLPSSRLGSLPSLFSVTAQVAHEQLAGAENRVDVALEPFLPPHLHDVLAGAYACASCRRFILPTSPISSPPFSERAHHLDPGISLPSRLPPPVPAPARFSPPTTPPLGNPQQPQHERPRYPSAAERPATLEQRLLLALLARLDAPPPPPRPPASSRRRDSEASLSSLASAPPPRRRRSARDDHEHDGGRRALPTLVLGATGATWRFCALCAAAHVGLEDDLALRAAQEEERALASEEGGEGLAEELERLGRWRCGCVVCCEERRVRGPDEVEEEDEGRGAGVGEGQRGKDEPARTRVLRWFRRKEYRSVSALLVAAVER
ncbi:hypothetical protein JCM8208_001159 [Rhodotorula glutinis]